MMSASGKRTIVYQGFLDETPLDLTDPANKRNKPEAVVHVLVGEIFKSHQLLGHVTIFGAPTRLVIILGILVKIERIGAKLVYHLQDDTGSIKCMKWLEEGREDSSRGNNLKLNVYIKVCGVLRVEESKPCVLILQCRCMQGLSELTSHMLEILYVAIMRDKDESESQMREDEQVTEGADRSSEPPSERNKWLVPKLYWGEGQSNHYGLSQYQWMVYNIIKNKSEHEKGASKADILFEAPAPVQETLNDILEFLVCGDHIYNTCSEEYFKAR